MSSISSLLTVRVFPKICMIAQPWVPLPSLGSLCLAAASRDQSNRGGGHADSACSGYLTQKYPPRRWPSCRGPRVGSCGAVVLPAVT